jgi:osmotically-inducible protein OsmY
LTYTRQPLAATAGSDAVLEARVKAALASDPNLLARHIQDLQLAERDAQAVPGVVSVENKLELKEPPKTGPH